MKLTQDTSDEIFNPEDLYLDQENDEGNREYKYFLSGDMSKEIYDKRTTQMNFRLEQGNDEAIYEIGVTDAGVPIGISEIRFNKTLSLLNKMACEVNASTQLIHKTISPVKLDEANVKYYKRANKIVDDTELKETRYVGQILIRRNVNKDGECVEVRYVVAGHVDAGKSTTIAVLTKGIKDDGNGKARVAVATHMHEIVLGRTSAISQEILGFTSDGKNVNKLLKKFKQPTWAEISRESSKICKFFDTAGHEKHFNLTITGICGIMPDYAIVVIAANMGVRKMTIEHMRVCLAHEIPMIFLMTKLDIAPKNILKQTMKKLYDMLKGPGIRKLPYVIKDKTDVINCCQNFAAGTIAPIIQISNKGEGINLDLVEDLINYLPSRFQYQTIKSDISNTLLSIQEKYKPQNREGTVVSGLLQRGVVSVKDYVWLGPFSNGKFKRVLVNDIEDNRLKKLSVRPGKLVCLLLKGVIKADVRKGMVILNAPTKYKKGDPEPLGIWEFDAEIIIQSNKTTSVKLGYSPVIHIDNIKQSANVIELTNVVKKIRKKRKNQKKMKTHTSDGQVIMRSGDRATIRFRFAYRPEFFASGSKIILREGNTRAKGVVTKIYFIKPLN